MTLKLSGGDLIALCNGWKSQTGGLTSISRAILNSTSSCKAKQAINKSRSRKVQASSSVSSKEAWRQVLLSVKGYACISRACFEENESHSIPSHMSISHDINVTWLTSVCPGHLRQLHGGRCFENNQVLFLTLYSK